MEAEIYKALEQLQTASGFTGDAGAKRLLEILSDATASFLSRWDTIVAEANRVGVCEDMTALLADEIATAIKKSSPTVTA